MIVGLKTLHEGHVRGFREPNSSGPQERLEAVHEAPLANLIIGRVSVDVHVDFQVGQLVGRRESERLPHRSLGALAVRDDDVHVT